MSMLSIDNTFMCNRCIFELMATTWHLRLRPNFSEVMGPVNGSHFYKTA